MWAASGAYNRLRVAASHLMKGNILTESAEAAVRSVGDSGKRRSEER
jgi:hypothetical protein